MRCRQSVLSRWRERRSTLQVLIDARDPDRWIWTVQMKVFTFLLSRYDRDESWAEAPVSEGFEAAPTPMPAFFLAPCDRVHPPMASREIRRILEDIQRNVQRSVEEEEELLRGVNRIPG